MEEGKKNIDDLFREGLGNYRERPGDHVWADLEKRLAKKDDGGAAAPVRSYRWVGYSMVVAALLILGYFSFYQLTTTAQRGEGTEKTEIASAAPHSALPATGTEAVPAQNNHAPSAESTKEENNETLVAQETASNGSSYSAHTQAVRQQAADVSSRSAISPSSSTNSTETSEAAAAEGTEPARGEIASAPASTPKPTVHTTTRRQHNIKVTTTTFDSEPEPTQAATRPKEITPASARNTTNIATGNPANTSAATAAGNANSVSGNTNTSPRTPVITNRTAAGANKATQTKQVQQPITAPKTQNNTAATTANTNAPQQTKVSGNTVAAKKENKVETEHKPPAGKTASETGQQKTASSVNTAIANTSMETGNKTSLPKTASSIPNNVTAPGAQAPTKEPVATMTKDNKAEKQIAPAVTVPSPGNNKSPNGQDDKTPAGNIKSGQLSLNGSKPGNDGQPVPAAGLSPSAKPLTSNNNSPTITQKVKKEPETQQDAIAKKGEAKDTPVKTGVADKSTTAGRAEGKHDERKQREKKPSQFEGGLKAGYEFNFAYGNANKYVIAPYIQYYFTPDISMVVQPAFKFGKASVGNVTGSSSYYDIKSSSFNSTRTITTGAASTSTVNYTYNYTQVYDSVLLGYNVGNQQLWDIELPLLLRYNLVPEVAFFLGPTLTYSGRLLQVTEDRMMYSGLTKTVTVNHGPYSAPDTSNPPPGPSPESYSSVLTYNAKPISELEKDKYINGVTKMFSVGYMAGFSFTLADRLMMDVQFQQRFVSNKKVPVQRFKDVYTQPYIRISLGYRLFGDKRKVFGENPE